MTMAEYIDREALLEKMKNWHEKTSLVSCVHSIPAADVVEVVRCKDCEYLMFSDFYGECSRGYLGIVSPNDYCSRAIRKGEAECDRE